MASPADLRAWIALLEREDELRRVPAEVDPDLEITEIVDRVVKAGGPALLFEKVKGSPHPLLINQFGTERRMCLAFGASSLDEVGQRLGDVLEMQPPEGLVAKVRGLQKLKSIADSRPKTVRSGRSQEVVLTGDDVNLDLLPIQRCWPGDPAPFVTLPAVITHDPRNGSRNVGMYRMQKLDRRSTLMHWQIHKDGRADYLFANGRLEVAVALGLDPVSAYSASAPLPKHVDEFMLAGFLKGSPVELVPAKTIAVDVPADAEIVLEGYVEQGDLAPEGPFGDHTGYYTDIEPFPVFHVTAMTMRSDAIYPSIVVGKPPQEDAWLGKATERIFLPAIRMSVPEIVDYDLPVAGAFHNCCIVAIRKAFPGHAQKVMHAIWGLGLLSLTKCVVVVDGGVNVHDYEEVFFRVCANVDPKRDVMLSEGPLDHLDHAPTTQFYGGKLGIDATHKGEAEGTRAWPPEIEMSDAVRALVDRRWPEYGIDLDPAARDGQIRQSSANAFPGAPLIVEPNRDQNDGPGPSLWPIGFALGVVCGLAGLILSSWPVVAVGAVIAVLAAAAWIRESTSGYETAPPEAPSGGEPAGVVPVGSAGDGDGAITSDEEIERFPRSVFLEGTTLGVGAIIAGVVTVPVVGFMVVPPFVKQSPEDADIGPISNFPEGKFVITTFFRDPAKGDVTRRTAFIRNNGIVDGKPSFTVISNRCAHLGCPVQANGPVFDKQKKEVKTPSGGEVTLIPAQPAGFGCPCHGGQYDTEGNRTAGPPVRALDRYSFAIHTGHLILLGGYSVSKVDGQGAAAIIHAYNLTGPGQHVTGPERFLYPWQPPH